MSSPPRSLLAILALAILAACSAPESAPTPPPDLVLTPGLSSHSREPGPTGRTGGTITQAATAEPASFHPYRAVDAVSAGYQALVYAPGLLRRDPETLEFIPGLAASWSLDPDGLTYTFTLRADARWSDGQPITAEDFRWTYEQASKPEHEYPRRRALEAIAAYEAPDPRTVRVRLKEPLAAGLELADQITPLPRHVWEKLDWNDLEKNQEALFPSVVSGPLRPGDWKRGESLSFVANDHYYLGRPDFDTFVVRIVKSHAEALELLTTGQVDWASVAPEDLAAARTSDRLVVHTWASATAPWHALMFNLRRARLKDPAVRRGLARAIDRAALVEKAQQGLGQPIFGPFLPGSWALDPDAPRLDSNRERAVQEMVAAGYGYGLDDRLYGNDGLLELTLLWGPVGNRSRETMATLVQEQLRAFGVEVTLRGLEWSAYLDALTKEPWDWDLALVTWRGTTDPHWLGQLFAEATIPELNSGAYVNKRVDELFAQAGRERDRAARQAAYREVQRLLAEDPPYVFLTMDLAYTAVSRRLAGVKPSPLGIGYNLEQWRVTGG